MGHQPSLWIAIFYAPVTEELAKLLPLLVPAVRRALRMDTCARLALAIGLGFGIGEAWFIAYQCCFNPTLAAMPFYLLGGFFGERFMVCLLHAAFLVFSLRWRGGILLAMLAHLGLNFPIALKIMLGAGHEVFWSVFLNLWSLAYLFGGMLVLARFSLGRFSPGELLLGRVRCPSCGQVFARSILMGANLGARRYEPCPHCKKWQFTSDADLVKVENAPGGDEPDRGQAAVGG